MNKTFIYVFFVFLFCCFISCNNEINKPDEDLPEDNNNEKEIILERNELFEDEIVKKMFALLEIETRTKIPEKYTQGYKPHSGDILHIEYLISPTTRQLFDLIPSMSNAKTLVYKQTLNNPDKNESFSLYSVFEKNINGEIIRKDSLDERYYQKYSLLDDRILVETFDIETNTNYYRETMYYSKGRNSTEFMKAGYLGLYNYYKEALIEICE